MLIIILEKYPKCKYCHKKMDHAVIGLAFDKHAHIECKAKAMVNKAIKEAFNES